ncbi:MAG: uncharacterized protein A8A55_3234, partial [Amphiamblys sp. WSBS2006]
FQTRNGFLSVKRRYLLGEAGCSDERIICIICHEETKLEDLVSPLCRKMHFVVCKECVQDIEERKNRAVVECPFCREKTSKKAYHAEIIEAVFSFQVQQTLCLEIRPDMEIETVSELTRETRVVLSNIGISDKLFFFFMSRTTVEIIGGVSLFGFEKPSVHCREGLVKEMCGQINICTDGYSKEEITQIEENTKKIQKGSIDT